MRSKKKESQNAKIRRMLDAAQKTKKQPLQQTDFIQCFSPWANNMGNTKQQQSKARTIISDQRQDQHIGMGIFQQNNESRLQPMPSYRRQLVNGFISFLGQKNNNKQQYVQRYYTQPFQSNASMNRTQMRFKRSDEQIQPWDNNPNQSYSLQKMNKRPITADCRKSSNVDTSQSSNVYSCQSNNKYKLYSKQSGRLRKVEQRNNPSDTIFVNRKKEIRQAGNYNGEKMTIFNPMVLPISGQIRILHSESAKESIIQTFKNEQKIFSRMKRKPLKSQVQQIKFENESIKANLKKKSRIVSKPQIKVHRVKSQFSAYNDCFYEEDQVQKLSALLEKKKRQQEIINRIKKKIDYQVTTGQAKVKSKNSIQFQGVRIIKGPRATYSMTMGKRLKNKLLKEESGSAFL